MLQSFLRDREREEEEEEEEEEIGELKRIPTRAYENREKLHEEEKDDDDDDNNVMDDEGEEEEIDEDEIYRKDRQSSMTSRQNHPSSSMDRRPSATFLRLDITDPFSPSPPKKPFDPFEFDEREGGRYGNGIGEGEGEGGDGLGDYFDLYISSPIQNHQLPNPKIGQFVQQLRSNLQDFGCRIYFDELTTSTTTHPQLNSTMIDETSYQALQTSKIILFPMTIEFWKEYILKNFKEKLWIELIFAFFFHSIDRMIPVILEEQSKEEIEIFLMKNNLLTEDVIANELWKKCFHFHEKTAIELFLNGKDNNNGVKAIRPPTPSLMTLFFSKRCEDLYDLIAKKIQLPSSPLFPRLVTSNVRTPTKVIIDRTYTHWNTLLTLPDYIFMIQQIHTKMLEILDQTKHIIRQALINHLKKMSSASTSTSTSTSASVSASFDKANEQLLPILELSTNEKLEIAKLLSPLQIALSHDIYNPLDWLNWSKMFATEQLLQHSLVKFCMKYKFFLYFFILLHIQQLIVDILLLLKDPYHHYVHRPKTGLSAIFPSTDKENSINEKDYLSVKNDDTRLNHFHRSQIETILSIFYGIFPEFHGLYPFSSLLTPNAKIDTTGSVCVNEEVGLSLPSLACFSRHSLALFFHRSYYSNLAIMITNSAGIQRSYLLTHVQFPKFLQQGKNPLQKIQQICKIINQIELRRLRVLYFSFHSTHFSNLTSIRSTLTGRNLSTASNPSMIGMNLPATRSVSVGGGVGFNGLSENLSMTEVDVNHQMGSNEEDLHLGDILMTVIYKFLKIINKQLMKWKFYLQYSNIYLFYYYYELFLLPYFQSTKEVLQEWERVEITKINNTTSSNSNSVTNSFHNSSASNSYNPDLSSSLLLSALSGVGSGVGGGVGGGGLVSSSSGIKMKNSALATSMNSQTSSFSLRLSFTSGSAGHSTSHQQQQYHQLTIIRISQNIKKLKHKNKLLIILLSQLRSIFINQFQEPLMEIENKKYQFDDHLHQIVMNHYSTAEREELSSILLDNAYEIRKEYRKLSQLIDRKRSRITIKLLKNQLTIAEEDIGIIIDDWQGIMDNLKKIVTVKHYFYQKKVWHRCDRLIQAFFDVFQLMKNEDFKEEEKERKQRQISWQSVGGEEEEPRFSELSAQSLSKHNALSSNSNASLLVNKTPPVKALQQHEETKIPLRSPVANRRPVLTPQSRTPKRRPSTASVSNKSLLSRSTNQTNPNRLKSPPLLKSLPTIDVFLPKTSYQYTSIFINLEKYFIYHLQQIPLQNLYIYELFRRYFSILYNVYEIRYSFLTASQRGKVYQSCLLSIQDIYYYERQLKKRRMVNLDWQMEMYLIIRLTKIIEQFMHYYMNKLLGTANSYEKNGREKSVK